MVAGRGFGRAIHSDWLRPTHGEGFRRVEIRATISADDSDRRAAPRRPVEVEARLRELGTTGTEARVLNISETGFMAETDGDFEVGARVWLMVPGRDRANAVVRWCAAGKIGAEFAEPLSPEVLP